MSYAVITGASKGIGKEIALELARKKYNLLLIARSGDLLASIAASIEKEFKVSCKFIAADLTSDGAVDKIITFIRENNLEVSVLVNNAGYGLWGGFEELSLKDTNDLMKINMTVPVNLTYLLLPELKKRNQSYILNIASTTAYQAVPRLAIYAACKTFMIQFSRALHYELRNSNVSVTCVSPGTTETNFMDAAGMNSVHIRKKAEKVMMKASTVAAFAVNNMFRKKNEVVPGWLNKISVAIIPFVPKSLTEKIAAGIYEK